ncbi:MAG: hypothetical protein ACRDSL_24125 [Pseudonocardiaceae bacterium]
MTGAPPDLTVAELARAWAAVAWRTTYLPMSGEEVEQLLTGLIDRLVAAVSAPRVDERAAIAVAAELVDNHLTGPRSMGRSIEVLGTACRGWPSCAASPGSTRPFARCSGRWPTGTPRRSGSTPSTSRNWSIRRCARPSRMPSAGGG